MTTRAEEIAAEGPYHVEKSSGVWVIMGPQGRWPFHFSDEWTAKIRADDFNKVYKQGQQDRWIPVSDRLPEEGLTVLAWDPSCMAHTMRYYPGIEHPWRDADPSDDGSFSSLPNVTHWMPIPSPPNPEQP